MADKATRERLKRQAAEQRGAKAPSPAGIRAPIAAAKAMKEPRERKCCQTISGKESPHAPTCALHPDNLKANAERRRQQKEKSLQRAHGDESRLPDGATFTGSYSAATKSWHIKLKATIEGEEQLFSRAGSNHDRMFHQLAGECRAWARKKAAQAKGMTTARVDAKEVNCPSI
jgi:hypothetical protein